MAAEIHFIFELIKIALLSAIYGSIISYCSVNP